MTNQGSKGDAERPRQSGMQSLNAFLFIFLYFVYTYLHTLIVGIVARLHASVELPYRPNHGRLEPQGIGLVVERTRGVDWPDSTPTAIHRYSHPTGGTPAAGQPRAVASCFLILSSQQDMTKDR